MRLFFYMLLVLNFAACKNTASNSGVKEASDESREANEAEFNEIDDAEDGLANPFTELDTVPGKLILSGTFMQEYDDDFYNIGFSIYQSGETAYFVHRILNEIVIDLESGISKPQPVDANDPEAIPLKIIREATGVTYKSVLNAWPDTFVKTTPEGKITSISLLKSVSRLVQDVKISMKDYTYPGQKARIVIDTDI